MEKTEVRKEENRRLCSLYPFLVPYNRFSGIKITEAKNGGYWPKEPDKIPEYDYEYTELDDMPQGWRKAFGEQMCKEIYNALNRRGGALAVNLYQIREIKEKFGELRWYDFNGNLETDAIISKYEDISSRTCIVCGKPATKISKGWISPYCDHCAKVLGKKGTKFKSIEG